LIGCCASAVVHRQTAANPAIAANRTTRIAVS
jgi:hypothetical protein